MSAKNWSADELIVTLDFYVQHAPSMPGKNSTALSKHCSLLNAIQERIGFELPQRSNGSVYAKLMNFRALDSQFAGAGLQNYSKSDAKVWKNLARDRDGLRQMVAVIRSVLDNPKKLPPKDDFLHADEAVEGQVILRMHQATERNARIVKSKKDQVLKAQGSLACEACSFCFGDCYGERGQGFIECHHTEPLSAGSRTTKLNDLALVCSNCHRMIHREWPWLSIKQCRQLVRGP